MKLVTCGNVRSLDRVTKHIGRSKVPGQMVRRGKMLKPNYDSLGYVHYVLTKGDGSRVLIKGQHIVASAFLGWRKGMHKEGLYVTHLNNIKDDNRLCNILIKDRKNK